MFLYYILYQVPLPIYKNIYLLTQSIARIRRCRLVWISLPALRIQANSMDYHSGNRRNDLEDDLANLYDDFLCASNLYGQQIRNIIEKAQKQNENQFIFLRMPFMKRIHILYRANIFKTSFISCIVIYGEIT